MSHGGAYPPCPGPYVRDYADGFDVDQKEKLRSRSQKRSFKNELDYWKGVYLVLFPGTPAAQIPSPCKHFVYKFNWIPFAKHSPVYSSEGVNYESYDQSSAYLRRTNHDFRERIGAIVGENAIDRVFDVINDFQASVIRPRMSQDVSLLPIEPAARTLLQPPAMTDVATYQPLPLEPQLDSLTGTNTSQDSGFYSNFTTLSNHETDWVSALSLNTGDLFHGRDHEDHENLISSRPASPQTIDPRLISDAGSFRRTQRDAENIR